jgi:hypothetical protein
MQEIRHNAGALRYLIDGPAGLLEFRITPVFAVLIHHLPDCDGEQCTDDCDAEGMQGTEIALAARVDGEDAIWRELFVYAQAAEIYAIPQPVHEPTAVERSFAARLRAEGQRMVNEGNFRNGQEN